jgi:site-specific DNA-methyltransferase (adenine-specific)
MPLVRPPTPPVRTHPGSIGLQKRLGEGIATGDFRQLGHWLKDDSLDLILTDPPYDPGSLALFGDVAKLARRVLKPGGLLLTYAGAMYLPDILARMTSHLDYLWMLYVEHRGGRRHLRKANVIQMGKPFLWFVKPPRRVWWPTFADRVGFGREKDHHPWQQAVGEAEYVVERLCPEGGWVLDPMCGSGTTLVAAKRLGRSYVGMEIDPETAETARQRLREG